MKIKHIPALIQSAAMAFLLATVTCQQTTFAQGSLTPPGAPAPTMKTLEQIEPRIPISSLPYSISQPGSYYLTTNLTGVAGQNGITITGARVTLDLMGFELRGVPGSLSGIHMNPATSPHVLNGSITGWGQDGINGTNGGGGTIERLRVSNNGRYGISFNSGSQIRHCIVFGNGNVGLLSEQRRGGGRLRRLRQWHAWHPGRHRLDHPALSGRAERRRRHHRQRDRRAEHHRVQHRVQRQRHRHARARRSSRTRFARSNARRRHRRRPRQHRPGLQRERQRHATGSRWTSAAPCRAASPRTTRATASTRATAARCSIAARAEPVRQHRGGRRLRGGEQRLRQRHQLPASAFTRISGDNRIENNNLTDNRAGLRIDGGGNYVAGNTVRNNNTNYVIASGNQLNILLSQLPQYVPWPATIKLAGTLIGLRLTNGITIASDDVTIDLNDHALVGVVQALDGIRVEGARTNITIRNGSLQNWPGDGVDANNAVNSQLRNLTAARNGGNGFLLGEGGIVAGCTARINTADGIRTLGGCRVTDCSASQNGGDGIETGTGSTISGCCRL